MGVEGMPSLEECLKIVEELYNSGVPVREIARRCNNSMSTVYKALDRLEGMGLIKRRKGRYKGHRRLSREEFEEIRRLYSEGRSIYEIARMLNRPESTVYYALKRLGFKQ